MAQDYDTYPCCTDERTILMLVELDRP